MNVTLLKGRILAEMPEENEEKKTESGIILQGQQAQENIIATRVVAAAEDCETVKEGHVVVFDKRAGMEIEFDEIKYKLITEDNIIAIKHDEE